MTNQHHPQSIAAVTEAAAGTAGTPSGGAIAGNTKTENATGMNVHHIDLTADAAEAGLIAETDADMKTAAGAMTAAEVLTAAGTAEAVEKIEMENIIETETDIGMLGILIVL